MIGRGVLILALVAALAGGVAQARPPAHAKTRAALADLVKAGAPGAVVLIRNGGSTSILTAGVADRKTHEPTRTGDHFRIASVTKSFVATVVLQLVGEGKLSLSDTVERFLPGLVPNGDGITVRQLLQHLSGLYNYDMDPRLFAPYLRGDLGYTWTPRQLVALAVSHPPVYGPGAHWSYSNTNYVLLGLIVEAVTGDTLANQLSKRILHPLGLQGTDLAAGQHMASPVAHGYYKGQDVTRLSFSFAWGAGSMVSTAADVARFYKALLGGKLLRAPQLKEMRITVPADVGEYGLGLWRRHLLCGTAWGHPGLAVGYTSYAWSSADGRHQVVVLSTTTAIPNRPEVALALGTLVEIAFCDR